MERIIEPTPLQKEFSYLFPSLVLASSSPNRKNSWKKVEAEYLYLYLKQMKSIKALITFS